MSSLLNYAKIYFACKRATILIAEYVEHIQNYANSVCIIFFNEISA